MSTDANRALITRLYDAMRAGDQARMFALLDEAVLIVVPGPDGLGAAGRWRGHDAARECFRRLGAGHVTNSMSVLDVLADGDKVMTRLHVVATAHATGKRFESEIVHLFTIRDGKIVELLDFFDTTALAEAYRA